MITEDWQEIKEVWYYFGADGRMVTGRQLIDGRRELFSDDGAWLGSEG